MTREEIIISEQCRIAEAFDSILDIYFDVYNIDKNDKSFNMQLRIVFSFYQSELNRLFKFLNERINGSKYYTANEGRQLLKYIDDIFNIQNSFFKTKYEFSIDKNYYFYMKKVQNIIGEHGTTLPDYLKCLEIKKYEPVFILKISSSEYIMPENNIDEVLTLVSTRNAKFDEMADDEKLENINIAIEHLLKEKQKYIDFDYEKAFLGYITKDDVIKYRNETHCFRHASENIEKRNTYSKNNKKFLANYGLTICMAILNQKKSGI